MPLQLGSTNIDFYLQHGWGFDGLCWQGWHESVNGCRVFALDRGYWGCPAGIVIEKSAKPVVLVTHSLGLHFVEDINLEFVDLLVILNGFQYFHGGNQRDGRFSRRHIQKMHRRLDESPLDLIHDFYNDCSYKHQLPLSKGYNAGLLADDLSLLDNHELDLDFCRKIPKILILHGENDRIVPVERALQLNCLLPASSFHSVPDAGHGLPFTHSQYCLEKIVELV